MELTNRFSLPVPIDVAWDILLDFPRIAMAMPGAKLLSVEGDHLEGEMLVKLGSMRVTYRGQAVVTERDRDLGRMVIEAKGRDDRGGSIAKARISTVLAAEGSTTLVSLRSTVEVTGRPAQMGAGLIEKVAQNVVDEFAARLSEHLSQASTDLPARSGRGTSNAESHDVLDVGKLALRPILAKVSLVLIGASLLILLLISVWMIWW